MLLLGQNKQVFLSELWPKENRVGIVRFRFASIGFILLPQRMYSICPTFTAKNISSAVL